MLTPEELMQAHEFVASHVVIYGKPSRVHLGEGVQTNNTIFNTSSGEITVGDRTIFGHNVMVITGRHEFEHGKRKMRDDVPLDGYSIRIGSGCWIASGAIISGGVTIGDNCVIAAGSVVVNDIPSGSFVAGVPAKIKRAA